MAKSKAREVVVMRVHGIWLVGNQFALNSVVDNTEQG
jgi:hypothetical protein